MNETIISHLAAQIDAIDVQINVLESEPAQKATDGQSSLAWGDRYSERSNALHDSLDSLADSISSRPAVDACDIAIQLKIALRTLRIVNGADTACPMTVKVERLVENALAGVIVVH
jgi:hypothetical protein